MYQTFLITYVLNAHGRPSFGTLWDSTIAWQLLIALLICELTQTIHMWEQVIATTYNLRRALAGQVLASNWKLHRHTEDRDAYKYEYIPDKTELIEYNTSFVQRYLLSTL